MCTKYPNLPLKVARLAHKILFKENVCEGPSGRPVVCALSVCVQNQTSASSILLNASHAPIFEVLGILIANVPAHTRRAPPFQQDPALQNNFPPALLCRRQDLLVHSPKLQCNTRGSMPAVVSSSRTCLYNAFYNARTAASTGTGTATVSENGNTKRKLERVLILTSRFPTQSHIQ